MILSIKTNLYIMHINCISLTRSLIHPILHTEQSTVRSLEHRPTPVNLFNILSKQLDHSTLAFLTVLEHVNSALVLNTLRFGGSYFYLLATQRSTNKCVCVCVCVCLISSRIHDLT